MIWTKNFEFLTTEYAIANNNHESNMLIAYRNAKNHFGHNHSIDKFIVIFVDGFKCIAFITNEFAPIEISDIVFPYDSKKAYPMQKITQKICFSTY